MLHNNNRHNEGYVQFISSILDRTLQQWNVLYHIDEHKGGRSLHLSPSGGAALHILDWGSGPEPVASELLRERGFQVESYDPLFGPPLPHEHQRFDIILCIEVAEHFKNPPADVTAMARYLKPGGLLAVHTHTLPMETLTGAAEDLARFFNSWWYKEDPTHVAFYSETSLRALGLIGGLRYECGSDSGDGSGQGTLHYFIKPLPVLVAGGANIDIEGRPFGPLIDRDSNPGRVRFTRGGAGRNIAENLARLNIPVQFISVFGQDPLSRNLLEETKAAGVGLAGAYIAETESPSCYLSILDDAGDMKLALSSMDSIKLLTPDTLESCLAALSLQDQASSSAASAFSMVVADGNLLPETVEALLDRFPGVPLWFDPVSTAKARRIASYKGGSLIGRFYGLKPNRDELFAMAESLDWVDSKPTSQAFHQCIESVCHNGWTSIPKNELEQLLMASRFLLDKGCKELHVSLGTEGVILMNAASMLWGRPPVLPMTSATGAGDSYLAAVLRTRCLAPVASGPDPVVSSGCAASAITLQDQDAVSQAMNPLAMYRLLHYWNQRSLYEEQRFYF